MSTQNNTETRAFQTEVKQLLDLMIHSLYSNKEIFLRELISNASDAADKLRFEATTDDALFEGDSDLNVFIGLDKDAHTITIRDNGIGMSRDEVVDNIGTIARSGTREFFDKLSGDKEKDAHLIGQFGVGFYSSFLVADRVTLTTRRAGLGKEHGVHWESAGDGEYSIETVEREARGTEIVLHLREEADEFLDDWRIRSVIHKYADHIPFPIRMLGESNPAVEVDGEVTEAEKPAQVETVNQASALWTRPKSELTDEDYTNFYKHIGHDFEDPLGWIHQKLEGKYEFSLLLYLPKNAPFDLWQAESRHAVKLYVKRVFIMEAGEDLMPRYLRFVRGVMDSSDLPLNVSREILQKSPAMDAMKKGATKRVLGLLEEMVKDNPEDYTVFWGEFGNCLKEGVVEDHANREKLAGLLRFASTESNEQTISLGEYIGRMKDGQETIYYITADTFAAASHSPHLEVFRKKGIEVLLLHDRIDEWLVSHLTEFDSKKLQSIAKGELDLSSIGSEEEKEAGKKAEEEAAKQAGPAVEKIKKALGERVKDVRVTTRLTESPACLVSDKFDISGNLERILRQAGQDVPQVKPILEINPEHELVKRLSKMRSEEKISDFADILFDQAVLAEGALPEDPAGFVRRINALLIQ
ncbi:MAG: molecular chaperone HtpG [Zetaproteobacteria bacterium CG06_land_8_20_14_3_00_59_53]|nr:MAG: molecular chaperone HtpG [Zetaproteobacteria bacterium CG2_30_59_37]PIO89333.1 MAG: molecular chaperone HtpG [Zetaproteobacteria bacterium CG23_combo_of_CG06-09_8_20_14_all_59_86]PIU70631.1 MAG: molecular chaperone HtpG [Zetaproteobacteria bacterium CG06_land_8_20_14_3_00_59_53]PIU98100.1 MAG: molecular chaperone HtpG [Zetaproteobacteria bacterium CG03_land_8_20_14_0_80_59_51]PIY47936.1 MAG: molecular chaperone HtpG [Zetaproteobacteria bacterium CG_4_10_14_0_8_um_filter_59_127]PJC17495